MHDTFYEKTEPTCTYKIGRYVQNQFSEKNIERLCNVYQMKYHIAEGIIFVSTETGNWRIIHNDDRVISVFHQSLRLPLNHRRKGRFEYGYHKQDINYTELEDVLKYIRVHDNTACFVYSKFGMDHLFQQISTC